MVNAGKWCVKIKSGGDANILLLNFYVLPALSSQLSVVSKLCIMNALLHFLLLLCQSCHCLRSVSFGGRILGLIKVLITVGWVWWRHQRGLLFSFASGPPNLKPTTDQSEPVRVVLKVAGSTLSLVGSKRRSIVAATVAIGKARAAYAQSFAL